MLIQVNKIPCTPAVDKALYWLLCWVLVLVLGTGCWVLDTECWYWCLVLGTGCWH